jgi:predicted NAD-dependent protein-ADP-ribosyltransferase YbiA (DUF1768 family)
MRPTDTRDMNLKTAILKSEMKVFCASIAGRDVVGELRATWNPRVRTGMFHTLAAEIAARLPLFHDDLQVDALR